VTVGYVRAEQMSDRGAVQLVLLQSELLGDVGGVAAAHAA